MATRPLVHFVYFDAGSGHRNAALALESAVASMGYNWDVRLINLQEILDSLDVFRKITRIRLQDIYNLFLAKGWTLGSAYLLPGMQRVIRLYHPAQVRVLSAFWKQERPSAVVSLVPNFNRALFESLEHSLPGVPMVTILTDMADYPPHFWIERQDQFLICGTGRAMAQAKALGYTKEKLFQTSGMILKPTFYDVPKHDRTAERIALGLDPALPTGLVLFGGQGSPAMYSIAKQLGNSRSDLQLILMCGNNVALREKLGRLQTRNRIAVEGFTKDVPRYMQAADFFIGKAGPGSISEAIQMGLPVIVERNAWTLPQERYNAEWIAEHGVGIVLKTFRQIDSAVQEMLGTNKLEAMRKRIKSVENRAVFEIPPILETILARSAKVSPRECFLPAQNSD